MSISNQLPRPPAMTVQRYEDIGQPHRIHRLADSGDRRQSLPTPGFQQVQLQVPTHAERCHRNAEVRTRQLLESEHVALEGYRLG